MHEPGRSLVMPVPPFPDAVPTAAMEAASIIGYEDLNPVGH
jgi:hypothetical protein